MNTKTKREHQRKRKLRKLKECLVLDFKMTTFILAVVCSSLITWMLYDSFILSPYGQTQTVLTITASILCITVTICSFCSKIAKEKSLPQTTNHTAETK